MQTNTISAVDFAKLVVQSNLTLTDDQKQKIQSQLNEALQAVQVLSQLDTAKVDSLTSASGLSNVWRKDFVLPSLSQADALSNAHLVHKGYFVVPAIFDNKDN